MRILKRLLRWTAGAVALIIALGSVALGVAYIRSDNDCAERAAAAPRTPIRAVVYCEYGDANVVSLQNIEKPVPAADQVLVRVHAASVNPLDYHYMRGTPYLMRIEAGLRKPKSTRLGVDYAGTVEAVGASVTQFKPGDAVFGGRNGAFAEYIVASAERTLALKPDNLSFEQAASMPVAGLTALQALRDKAQVRPGQKVLINGASGGVGTFAVQIAKSMGAEVTGVCSTRNVPMVRSIGADHVIDYTRQNFLESGQRYDAVIDMVGNHPLSAFRRVLQPNGVYVLVGGPKGRWIAPMDRFARATILSWFVDQKFIGMLSQLNKGDLTMLADLARSGKLTPVIDRRYPLTQVGDAIAYLETGRARGKVVVNVVP